MILRNKFGARHAAALVSAALVVLFMPLVLVCLAAASPLVALAYTAWHTESRGPRFDFFENI